MGGGVLPGKRSLIAFIVVSFIAFFSYILYGDLHLDRKLLERASEMDMTIELKDVNFKRGYKDDLWLFSVESIERLSGRDKLVNIAGEREGLDGSKWSLRSPVGDFIESNDMLSLKEGQGSFSDEKESFSWSAPHVLWAGSSSDMWSFPSGVVVSGDSYNMRGAKGEASPSGKLYLQEGVVQWLKE